MSDHLRAEARILHIDVGLLMDNLTAAMHRWMADIQSGRCMEAASNVERHLQNVVKVTPHLFRYSAGSGMAGQPVMVTVLKTN
jgi:hypothetical protein